MLTTNELKTIILEKASVIRAPVLDHLTFDIPRDDGTPCILVDGDQYSYFAQERGKTIFSRKTENIIDVIYWVFSHVTFVMAMVYESKNRIKNVDTRRLLFSHQLSLLEKVDPNWAKKMAIEIDEIVTNNPYVDKVI